MTTTEELQQIEKDFQNAIEFVKFMDETSIEYYE